MSYVEGFREITESLRPPRTMRIIRRADGAQAIVARLKHTGGRVDLSGAELFQVIFNISGGQVVRLHAAGTTASSIAVAGSVAIGRPQECRIVELTGPADTLQILMSREFIGPFAAATIPEALASHSLLRAAAIRMLVVLDRDESTAELESGVAQVALAFHESATERVRASGGLSPQAFRRVRELIEQPHSGSVSDLTCSTSRSDRLERSTVPTGPRQATGNFRHHRPNR